MLRQAQQPQGSAVLPSTSSGTAEGAGFVRWAKKEARGVEPRASDDYYCSAGLSVSIGQ